MTSPDVVTRAEARHKGLGRYFTGIPCKHGHVSERYVGGRCVECSRRRYAENPERHREQNRRRYAENPEKYRERNRRRYAERYRERKRLRYAENSVRVRDQQRLRRYGVAPEEFEAQLALQGGACALCETRDYGRQRPHIDHRRDDGKVRGILCGHCNTGAVRLADNGRAHLVTPWVRYYAQRGCWGDDWPAFEVMRREAGHE